MRMRTLSLFPVAALACVMLTTASHGAETQVPQAPEAAPSPAPPNTTTPNDKSTSKPLGKKLDETEGVLKPPKGVDPEMHIKPPANTGDKMPVIVPPGEPGGDQSVQPK
jgi:hypothetical protein